MTCPLYNFCKSSCNYTTKCSSGFNNCKIYKDFKNWINTTIGYALEDLE